MSYKIFNVRVDFKDGKLDRIVVLAEMSQGDLRGLEATTKPRGGYMHIQPSTSVKDQLFQEIAGYGMTLPIETWSKLFPGVKNRYLKSLKKIREHDAY